MPGLPRARPANSGIYVHVVFLAEVKRNAGAFCADTHTNNGKYVHGVLLAYVKCNAETFSAEHTQITINTSIVCFLPT